MNDPAQDAFYRSIPRRRAGSGALLTDQAGRILIVEPRYKATWEIPGGIVETGEDPRTTCQRECLEELGLDIELGRLLALEHKVEPPPQGDSIMFIYDGGPMIDDAVIQLQREELCSYRFIAPADLGEFMTPGLAHRVRSAARARDEGSTVEIVNGMVVGR